MLIFNGGSVLPLIYRCCISFLIISFRLRWYCYKQRFTGFFVNGRLYPMLNSSLASKYEPIFRHIFHIIVSNVLIVCFSMKPFCWYYWIWNKQTHYLYNSSKVIFKFKFLSNSILVIVIFCNVLMKIIGIKLLLHKDKHDTRSNWV